MTSETFQERLKKLLAYYETACDNPTDTITKSPKVRILKDKSVGGDASFEIINEPQKTSVKKVDCEVVDDEIAKLKTQKFHYTVTGEATHFKKTNESEFNKE